MIEFYVPGRPQAQGSKVKGRWGNIHEDNKELGPWRERVALAAYAAAHGPDAGLGAYGFVFDVGVPVAVGLEFILYRPTSAPKYRTPPATKKPDIDKMERAILDALTHVLWPDDAQVTIVIKCKRVAEKGEMPGVNVWVCEAENTLTS